jgi:hypothetical protein
MKPPDDQPMDGTEPPFMSLDVNDEYMVNQLSRDQLRLLWLQHLGHIHSNCVARMHDAADIPKVPVATELDTCPVCAHTKLHKAACGKTSSH